ncbi:MAG: dienelactone hydrolase family protein, partial [Alphaproteobacteria bacterium]|nr:dienelactone hydrolase family protein [Alphaproteobacteria bacterium]
GKSQGAHDKGEGELSDAAAALDWMQALNPNAPYVWVGGFAFGAWIGMQLLMRRPEIRGFISAVPPANVYDFSFLAPCPTSGLIINGDNDNMVPPVQIQKLVDKLRTQKGIKIDHRMVGGANHFFKSRIGELVEAMHDHMNLAQAGKIVDPAKMAELLLAEAA